MAEFTVKKLILAAPLVYRKDDSLRFPSCGTDREEVLFRLALDPSQSRSIEPDRAAFPGRLVTAGSPAGRKEEGEGSGNVNAPDLLELPAGTYFFAQVREPALGTETLINMIIEVQQEGLWERFSLDERLYIRRLFEDGRAVVQVFRPAGNPLVL
ncbi:MAG: hypothetical protein LBH57_03415 [Treponema sp.]|jgi:hypothetical protein|nr:hypothetical protein [Treponema sp.]